MMPWLETFYRPATVFEAVRLVKQRVGRVRFVGGGTDLRPDRAVKALVDTTSLKLAYIRRRDGGWAIGAATTLGEIERSEGIRGLADGLLSSVVKAAGSAQVRNLATLGGRLASASPAAAEIAAALLVLDAAVAMAGPRGSRSVPLEQFYHGARRTVLGDSLLTEITIPDSQRGHGPGARAAWSFQRTGRLDSDLAVAGVAAGVGFDGQGMCLWARLALAGLTPAGTPAAGPVPALRVPAAERLLAGRRLDPALIERACDRACAEMKPAGDSRATAAYRMEVARVLVRRALADCAAG